MPEEESSRVRRIVEGRGDLLAILGAMATDSIFGTELRFPVTTVATLYGMYKEGKEIDALHQERYGVDGGGIPMSFCASMRAIRNFSFSFMPLMYPGGGLVGVGSMLGISAVSEVSREFMRSFLRRNY